MEEPYEDLSLLRRPKSDECTDDPYALAPEAKRSDDFLLGLQRLGIVYSCHRLWSLRDNNRRA